ncbi:MAG TPA: hypothetical protein VF754_10670, partial [Pyrinomonadaceae bacterium]
MANVSSEQKRMKEAATTAAVAASEASWPQTRAILRIIFIALAVVAVLFILYALTGVLLLVVLSIFFAYLIAPLVEMVRRPFSAGGRSHKLPRAAAIGVVYFLIFGTLATTIYLLMPRI